MASMHSVLASTTLLALTFGTLGCTSQDEHLPSTAAPAAQSASAAKGMKIQIRPGGQYFLAGKPDVLTADQLAERLRGTDPADFGKAIYVVSYPGVVGYDVVLAMNAAQDAGFTRAEGLVNYRDEPSAGPAPSPWQMDLSRSMRTATDTTPRG